ncbi:MAG: MBL fold metallo-hydrolase [Clostridium sp.]
MIKFNGIGSAFNTDLGNNSAYIKKGDSLLLLDCGCTVFHRIKANGLLKGIKNIFIILTHTHPDHTGSVGDIIFYAYHILNKKVNIIFNDREHLEKYFSCIGVQDEMYTLYSDKTVKIDAGDVGEIKLEFIKAHHVNTLPAFSFLMEVEGDKIYYSGDSGELPKEIIEGALRGEIQRIYQDTSSIEVQGNPHISLKRLSDLVPNNLREKVFCMHLDSNLKIEDIKSKGFNIAEINFGN